LSGIVGIYHRNGAPLEQALLQALVDFLAYRALMPANAGWMGPSDWVMRCLKTARESEERTAACESRGAVLDCRGRALDGRAA